MKSSAYDDTATSRECSDMVMALEAKETSFNNCNVNLHYMKQLVKLSETRPVIYPVQEQYNPVTVDFLVTNTGQYDIRFNTDVAVVPVMCKSACSMRHRSVNGDLEVFCLQTVDRVRYADHLRQLLDFLQTTRRLFDVTDVAVSGGYKTSTGALAGGERTALDDDTLKRTQEAFRVSISDEVVLNLGDSNYLWEDLKSCCRDQAPKMTDYEILREMLTVLSHWSLSSESQDKNDLVMGAYYAIRGVIFPTAGEMTEHLEAAVMMRKDNVVAGKRRRADVGEKDEYISNLYKYFVKARTTIIDLTRFLKAISIPSVATPMRMNHTTTTPPGRTLHVKLNMKN